MKTVTLNNGVEMPILGYGVYQVPDYDESKKTVLTALESGYRSIDTAQDYGNEQAVGDAIKESGIPVRIYSLPPNCGFPITDMKRPKGLLMIR